MTRTSRGQGIALQIHTKHKRKQKPKQRTYRCGIHDQQVNGGVKVYALGNSHGWVGKQVIRVVHHHDYVAIARDALLRDIGAGDLERVLAIPANRIVLNGPVEALDRCAKCEMGEGVVGYKVT